MPLNPPVPNAPALSIYPMELVLLLNLEKPNLDVSLMTLLNNVPLVKQDRPSSEINVLPTLSKIVQSI